MEGPIDPEIQQTPSDGPQAAVTTTAAAKTRPPGGKALLRLLQHLERRGLAGIARQMVDTAVPEEHREEFRTRTPRYSALMAEAEAAGESHPAAESVAEQYMQAAHQKTGSAQVVPQAGPPTGVPTGS